MKYFHAVMSESQMLTFVRGLIIIIIIQIFKEESLSHSKVLFMRVLYLTNCSDLFKTL